MLLQTVIRFFFVQFANAIHTGIIGSKRGNGKSIRKTFCPRKQFVLFLSQEIDDLESHELIYNSLSDSFFVKNGLQLIKTS